PITTSCASMVGTVGRTGIPGYFIGNTAEAILGRIDCAIMAVKPPGFLSPVVS
ncbi:MAG: universal stress protein, partial [Pseudomonadota bacterium]